MRPLLLDTGPIIASLDRQDACHGWVLRRLGAIRGPLVTTGAVMAEAMFFLQEIKGGPPRLAEMIETSGSEIWDCFTIRCLHAAVERMAAYADVPMDFADATLVLAAEHYSTADILTLDERGFRTFRYSRNKPFRLLLQDDG
jgi:predicted nucleic acid-binding protein